jgi:predicted PolB exonuclease-like 3'-5' exonuclease
VSHKEIAFDLETVANQSVLASLPPAKAAVGNLKDPEKIIAKQAEAEKERRAKAGLNPHHNRIAVFGWADGESSGHLILEAESDEAERRLIVEAWDILSNYERFVTFNGDAFDIPIMRLHSLFLKVRPGVRFDTRRYTTSGNHIDLRAVLNNWSPMAPGNFDLFCKLILGQDQGKAEQMDGSWVQDYWDVGMRAEIGLYGQDDAEKTFAMYQAVKQFYL